MRSIDLDAALDACEVAQFTIRVDRDLGAYPAHWPADVVEQLMADDLNWRARAGDVSARAVRHACVFHDGDWHCVREVRFERAALEETSAGHGCARVRERSLPVRPAARAAAAGDLTAVARCAVAAGIGGYGRHG